MRSDADLEMLYAMERYGDISERIVAQLCMSMDEDNFQRLRLDFPEMFKKYLEIALLERQLQLKGGV